MPRPLHLYNTLTAKYEAFTPLRPPYVGMYLCGPTVYGPPHLGHARSAVVFDILTRYLRHTGYKVTTVRNITDVGHMTEEYDEGEDKIIARAAQERTDPMVLAQRYTHEYHTQMAALNVLPPDIEPRATGHITEQIELTKKLLARGFAYEANGSVYFDVSAYQKKYPYGILSKRTTDHTLTATRPLVQGGDKRDPVDFALWKCAPDNHLMRWPSPWGPGFPGWHLECTAMGSKYLGVPFDLHCGGLDLMFPHHECELAQGQAAFGRQPVHYWMHHNMLTINGQKMSKSLGNFITLADCFTGNHPLLSQAAPPMVVRFFILQAHYRSTVNFSDEALQSAAKGYYKLLNGLKDLAIVSKKLQFADKPSASIEALCEACYAAMDDDLNTAKAIGFLFDLLKYIHQAEQAVAVPYAQVSWERLVQTYQTFMSDILGLGVKPTMDQEALLDLLLAEYTRAKTRGEYATVDAIRAALAQQGITVQDKREGVGWKYTCE